MKNDEVECHITITCIGGGDRWEASCTCGFWTKGTKRQCEDRARSGHPPRKV